MTLDELKRFCGDKDEIRWYLREPWTRDGYSWATNGHIAVRVPAIDGLQDCEKAPDVAALFAKTEPAKDWVPVPVVSMPPPGVCRWCQGDGKDTWDRRYKCEECNGTGEAVNGVANHEIGNVHFADIYLALIQGWEIAPNGAGSAAWIRNDDALGLLMPMRV